MIGDVLGTSFKIWIANLVPFAILALLFYVPLLIWDAVAPVGAGSLGGFSLMLLLHMLLQAFLNAALSGALVYAVFKNLTGQKVGLPETIKMGLSRIGDVFVVGLVSAILIGIGTILLFVPGIIIACILAVAVPVAVVERKGLGDAFSRSAFLTKGSRIQIFVLFLIFGLIAMLIGLVLGVALAAIPVIGPVILTLLVLLFSALPSGVMQAVLYHRVRSIKEGTSVEEIAKVFA